MSFNLSQTEELPSSVRERLIHHEALFQRAEFLEHLLEHNSLRAIAAELNVLCESERVIGYHYTRGFRDKIEAEGLIACSGDDRRQRFLAEFGDRFTPTQYQRLLAGWDDYFNRQQNSARDGRIWFVLTLSALGGSGAEPLLHHYGGEVIYMPFKRDQEIAAILHSIGEPMIVECTLDTSSLHTFSSIPWGKVWLSTYHRSVNPRAYQFDVDVYCTGSVPAADIVSIHPVSQHGL